MKNCNYEEYKDPVYYSDCATTDLDLLSSILGEEAEGWVRWYVTPVFFSTWHWN